MKVILNSVEIARLDQQDPLTEKDGGFQGLIVKFQKLLDRSTGELDLTPDDLEKLPRYAFDYDKGGWENTLIAIFSRTLGPQLGR